MEYVFIEHRCLECKELETEEALDVVQSRMMELLNKAKGQFWQMRKQKVFAKEYGLKLAGVFFDELESEELSGRSQGVLPVNIVLDWSDINFGELGMFDFGDIVIEDTGNTGGF